MSVVRRGVWPAAFVVGCTLALSACAGASEEKFDAWGSTVEADISNFASVAPLSEGQKAALADGAITEEEVQQSFERYRACLREQGYDVENIAQDGPLITFAVPNAAVQSGVDEECNAREYGAVDVVWQTVVNADFGERVGILVECLDDLNIDVKTSNGAPATVVEMEQALAEAGVAFTDCQPSE